MGTRPHWCAPVKASAYGNNLQSQIGRPPLVPPPAFFPRSRTSIGESSNWTQQATTSPNSVARAVTGNGAMALPSYFQKG
jgi:hypothetical protein